MKEEKLQMIPQKYKGSQDATMSNYTPQSEKKKK